jgi:hypothetical protein
MLSVIGLGLDIIGAIVLALVLFQRFTATFGGRARSDDVRDWALGIVGALFLVSGFVLQLLPHFGIGPGGTNGSRAEAWRRRSARGPWPPGSCTGPCGDCSCVSS